MKEVRAEIDRLEAGVVSDVTELVSRFADRLCEVAQKRIGELENELHAEEDLNARLTAQLEELGDDHALRAAEALCEWARGEAPDKVARVLEAIRGGHTSDLFLIL